jgi:4-amino-4-deoxy-L-arabinose transferase-like glycosyltransferase
VIESRLPPWTSVLVLTLLLPVMVWLSADYGVTWDELPRQAYGERVWQFYEGRSRPDAFHTDPAGSHLYGGLFDLSAVALQKLLPLDPYLVRHNLNAVVGWLGIVACFVLAARVGGRDAGLLAVLLLVVTPRYWGDAMNNPKDLPFATCATAALAVLAAIPARYPVLTSGRVVALGGFIGLSLSVRPGGLLFLGYAGVVVALQLARSASLDRTRVLVTAGQFLVVAFIATTVPLAFWPWLQSHPYVGLLEALNGVSRFQWRGMMVFNGGEVNSMRLPWTYVPIWLLYTTPLVTFAGAALALALGWKTSWRLAAFGLLWAVLFPIVYVIVKHSTLYDGIRHLLFIQPVLAALSALGWLAVLGARARLVRRIAAVILAAGVAEPVVFAIRNHPNEIVYFNPLIGGPAGAEDRFELDYWGNCLYETQRAVARLAVDAQMPVAISGHRWRVMHVNAARIPQISVTRPEQQRHHIEVVLVRGSQAQARALRARADRLVSVQTADGALLCAAVPGPAFAELAARLARRTP